MDDKPDLVDWLAGTFTWLGIPGWLVILFIVVLQVVDLLDNSNNVHKWLRRVVERLPSFIQALVARCAAMTTGQWRATNGALLVVGFATVITAGQCSANRATSRAVVNRAPEVTAQPAEPPQLPDPSPTPRRIDDPRHDQLRENLKKICKPPPECPQINITYYDSGDAHKYALDFSQTFNDAEWPWPSVTAVPKHVWSERGLFFQYGRDQVRAKKVCNALRYVDPDFQCTSVSAPPGWEIKIGQPPIDTTASPESPAPTPPKPLASARENP